MSNKKDDWSRTTWLFIFGMLILLITSFLWLGYHAVLRLMELPIAVGIPVGIGFTCVILAGLIGLCKLGRNNTS